MRSVYDFEDGDGTNKKLLGGKGAGLCTMTKIGLPVPQGFVITTEQCKAFIANNNKLPEGLMEEVKKHMAAVEKKSGKVFGGETNPLLVSVRSGAAMSMPGMMDTILNLGLNDKTVVALAKLTNNERFAYDSYRRFVSLFGRIALGVEDAVYDKPLEEKKVAKGVKLDTELSAEDMKELAQIYIKKTEEATKNAFPMCPFAQLECAISAVFRSWMGRRAVDYRREFKITDEQADGTGVSVVSMVYGNMGNDSATGVCFTRDPGTGENVFFGEYLKNAQGEDVVAGIRTPQPINTMADDKDLPDAYNQLLDIRKKLEGYFHEVQDFEFTIEKNKVYMLQTRNGKMNAVSTVRTGVEMVSEGLITKEQAILRLSPQSVDQLLHKNIPVDFKGTPLVQGLPASPGAACGAVVFDADDAVEQSKAKKVLLLREETKPEDIHGFFVAQGILTCRGGKTSHAAVVARGMGKPCVSGAEGIKVDVNKKVATIGSLTVKEGDILTIDGSTGKVYQGELKLEEPNIGSGYFGTMLQWANEIKKIGVFANADLPSAAKKAIEFGAEGIGLCRTERMFNAVERLPIVVKMILAETIEERNKFLNELMPLQKEDFRGLLTTMNGLPVTIRLLDPPLHEFLPTLEELMREIFEMKLANKTEGLADKERVMRKVKELMEVNPMIGHRGIRLGTTNPEIYEMQIRAFLEATAEVIKAGIKTHAEIMIPNVTEVNELIHLRKTVLDRVHKEVETKYGIKVPFMYGTMVECVRAALTADKIATEAEFFSFGTNDLTQGTFSYSREDCENKFLPKYVELKILPANPFEILDRPGVGEVMKIGVERGRKTRPDLIVGICGEHGGEPSSIEWCHMIGLNYVSCSSFRIPVARIAAAQAQIRHPKN
ncbi:pyruvate, phosphate dikinase, putative [Entamoeba invadens IP1]|uniref:Pyruvate, phosphate dikinase n=1 Tax=Entamoeba invadens IP1 TaxID=370355 RepID=A0A0A1UES6_ENTIV|nr:pyruvate, phosphate dikinase, putative [Entamoeba invadens IP1]ELP91326.1 pyruvate, phosphate dikinase, putative [Entamoeba invadens IP1]|eukprot:XP_004258097.1 pyruvate, phosphate dikinase, putative [Entamoeba invadens IP1]